MRVLYCLVGCAGIGIAAVGLRFVLVRPRPLDLAGMVLAPAGVWLLLAGLWGLLR